MSKLRTIPTLALLAVLVACEGEPPLTPADLPPVIVSAEPTPDETASAKPVYPTTGIEIASLLKSRSDGTSNPRRRSTSSF